MNIDDLLNGLVNKNANLVPGERYYVLEYNLELRSFRTRKLSEVYESSTSEFTYGDFTGWSCLGIFDDEESANELVRTLEAKEIFKGKTYRNSNYYALAGNALKNWLEIWELDELFDVGLYSYSEGIQSNWLLLGIFSDKESAEDWRDFIRLYFKDENGNLKHP